MKYRCRKCYLWCNYKSNFGVCVDCVAKEFLAGERELKAHLSRFDGRWLCVGRSHYTTGYRMGFGPTPAAAYDDWTGQSLSER